MSNYTPREVVDLEEASSNYYEDVCQDSIARVRTKASKIEQGESGICDICDTESARLVLRWYRDGKVMSCAPCRDALKLG